MSLDILNLSPDTNGYTVTTGVSTLVTQLDGGSGRYRKDQLGASSTVQVTYTLGVGDYQYLLAFFRTVLQEGSLAFQTELLFETPDVTDYCCNIVPGTFKLSSQQGETYVVVVTYEATSINPPDPTVDLALVVAYNTYGSNTDTTLSQLAYLVNVQMNF